MAFTMTVADLINTDRSGLLQKHESWERVPLSMVAEVLNGYPFDSARFSDTSGTPLVRIRDVLSGSTKTYYAGEYEPQYVVEAGDLLVGMDGDFNSGYWRSSPSLLNQRVCKVMPIDQYFDKRLLGLLLPGYLSAINANTPSITVKHLSSRTIGEILLPLPPRAEQSRIAAKLDELLSDLDAGTEELQAARAKLSQYRQSLLKAAVEGALTAEWRAQHPPAENGAQLLQRILTERRARWEAKQLATFNEQGKTPPRDWQEKYPEREWPDSDGLPSLPQGWAWARVDQAGDVQLGRQRAPQFHTGENMVPYLRVANVFEDRIDVSDVMEMHFSAEDETAFRLQPGDVLLNEGQSLELVGRPAIFRGELPRVCFTNTLVRFRAEVGVRHDYALAVFLHYMHSGRFRKIAKITTNIAHLGAGRFAELEFPLPPIDEQAEIVRLLKASMDEVYRQGSAIAHALHQSAAQRQNILRAAFSGQLVPQDPNDEPATELLTRIRAERAACETVKKPRGRRAKETV